MTPHEPHAAAGAERGIMVVVVGPSGAGKDTLMNLAARRFAGRAASMEQMASNIKQNADNAAQTEKIARSGRRCRHSA